MEGVTERLIKKKVYVILKSSHTYTGTLIEVNGSFITIEDKFGKIVSLNNDSIAVIKEDELDQRRLNGGTR